MSLITHPEPHFSQQLKFLTLLAWERKDHNYSTNDLVGDDRKQRLQLPLVMILQGFSISQRSNVETMRQEILQVKSETHSGVKFNQSKIWIC